MNKKIKAFFVDLDGTFLDQIDDTFSPVSQANLEKAKEVNKERNFIISTGRSNSEFVLNLAREINSKYIICQNGAVIVDKDNNILVNNLIENETAKSLKEFLEQKNLNYTINGDPIIYTNNEKNITLDRPWAKEFVKKSYKEANLEQNINRMLTFGLNSKELTKKLSNEILTKFPNLRTHIVSKGLSLEITNKNSTKGIGNLFICNLLNIKVDEAWHIGDSGNDICVKEQGFKLAIMANAIEEIKNEANFLSIENINSGVAKTIDLLDNMAK
ncbi:HAD-IIB family hydrolase [Mycoplasmopsis meleagridis]|uniref:HAD-IIB family hydrolase n=1 Tax=Mycoplasmopsis meleagridis TaxID=29561 RepID=UPI003A88D6E4